MLKDKNEKTEMKSNANTFNDTANSNRFKRKRKEKQIQHEPFQFPTEKITTKDLKY